MKTLIFRGEDTKISKIFLGENPAFAIKYQNVYDQIYFQKMIRIVVKTLKFLKNSWGEPPLRQNNQSQYNTFNNLIKLKSMKNDKNLLQYFLWPGLSPTIFSQICKMCS